MLPDPHAAPGAVADEDNWGWLITFSDLVLQLFGFAMLIALGGAATHGLTASPPAAPTAPVAAPLEEVATAAPPVRRSVTRAPVARDEDALPPRTADGDADAVPVPVAASAPVAAPAEAPAPAPARLAGDATDRALRALASELEGFARSAPALAATVTTKPGEVVVEIGAMAGFARGSADPVPAMSPLLAALRARLVAAPALHVEVSGHTDDVPIRTALFPSNLELSLARASRVAQELIGGDAKLRTRVSAAGYGEQRPVAPNGDPEGRARNRRVEIRLTHG